MTANSISIVKVDQNVVGRKVNDEYDDSISVVEIPELPSGEERERSQQKHKLTLKDACKSILILIGIIIICILFVLPLTTIPRTDALVYQSYWMENCLPGAVIFILYGANEALTLKVWTKEKAFTTFRVCFLMFLMHYIPFIILYMVCYFTWSVYFGFYHPLPYLGLMITLPTWIIFQVGLWFFLPSHLLKNQDFRRKLRFYMIYFLWTIVVIFQNEFLSFLFLNPPGGYQFLVPFVIAACREVDLRIRSKIVKKMTGDEDVSSAALLDIAVNVTYASFVAIRLADAKTSTVYSVVAMEFVIHLAMTYQVIKEYIKIAVEYRDNENSKKLLTILISTELIEGFVPIIHGICTALAYYGPNANLLANISSSYWGDKIEDIGTVYSSMTLLFSFDVLSALATSLWLWKTLKVNMIQEFHTVIVNYWVFMVIKLALNETPYLSSLDVNFGADSTLKFQWINEEGWKSLVNASDKLTDENKLFLLNSTIIT